MNHLEKSRKLLLQLQEQKRIVELANELYEAEREKFSREARELQRHQLNNFEPVTRTEVPAEVVNLSYIARIQNEELERIKQELYNL